MIQNLKKLEANDVGKASSLLFLRTEDATAAERAGETRTVYATQAYAVPSDGWLGGPGRWRRRSA